MSDPTGKLEEMVEAEVKKMMKFVREQGPRIINRPLGTAKIPKVDLGQDFEAIREDIPALQKWHLDLMDQFGAEWGTQIFVREYKRMMGNGTND